MIRSIFGNFFYSAYAFIDTQFERLSKKHTDDEDAAYDIFPLRNEIEGCPMTTVQYYELKKIYREFMQKLASEHEAHYLEDHHYSKEPALMKKPMVMS